MKRAICIGSSAIDRRYRFKDTHTAGSAARATLDVLHGGVMRNVAETLALLSKDRARVALLSAIGSDGAGTEILTQLERSSVDTTYIRRTGQQTSECAAIIDHHGTMLFEAWVAGAEQPIDHIEGLLPSFAQTDLLIFDDHFPDLISRALPLMETFVERPTCKLMVVTTGAQRAALLPAHLPTVDLLICNQREAQAYETAHHWSDTRSRNPPQAAEGGVDAGRSVAARVASYGGQDDEGCVVRRRVPPRMALCHAKLFA